MGASFPSCGFLFCPQSSPCPVGAFACRRCASEICLDGLLRTGACGGTDGVPSSGLPEKIQTARKRTQEPLMPSMKALPCVRLRQTARVGDSSTPLSAGRVEQDGRLPFCHLYPNSQSRGPRHSKRLKGLQLLEVTGGHEIMLAWESLWVIGVKARSCWHGSHWGSLAVTKSCWPRTQSRTPTVPVWGKIAKYPFFLDDGNGKPQFI